MQAYTESVFAAMDPAARIRWLGGQCAEFERRLQDAVPPDLVPRFRAGLEELVVTWEREHGQTGEGIDGVTQLRELRDWAVSNGKPSPVIDEFLATHTKFSILQEDFREGILKPLKEGFPKHSCKKVRKVEKKLTTILSSWKDLLKKSPKVKDRTVQRTPTEKKESTNDGFEGLIPALQETAQQALKLARKWGRLLEDDVLQQVADNSIQTPEENNRIRHPLAVGTTSTGQAGPVSVVGTNEAHGRVSSAKYRGDAGFSKGISDLKTEFEQIRQDALMYEYSLERERAAHIKKELTGMESRKREIKQKLQAEKATANFLTLGANVDRVRDRVGQLQTELARVSAKYVETEKRLQESSDRSVTLAAGIRLWSENKTSRRLEPINRRASCKNSTKKAAQGEGKALRL
ncbi:PREDICTED: uncharacterized protein LOC109481098 [Branchiostoma belcheri]|uniref:Uncharacterized protein LOC109481098 n=1 Tax=Branchiostoma belcheri TaxID=7741 RepID=A0A6P5A759_BRABE|nr:PREDICTED: uncharacterized protein LOC109481098 [Branchiostoma belcheri]